MVIMSNPEGAPLDPSAQSSEPVATNREPADTLDPAMAALIRNEVKVTKTLTSTHRRVAFVVGKRHPAGTGLVAYVRAICPRYEPHYIARWCEQGRLKVNDQPVGITHQPVTGEQIELHVELPPPDPSYTPPPLNIVWHDDHLAVLCKEPGHLAHQAGKVMTGTLINQLQDWMLAQGRSAADVRLVNRIDRDTSGLVLASFDLPAHVGISESVAKREVHKEYLAICEGIPTEDHGEWKDPIGESPRSTVLRMVRPDGLPCRTEYHVIGIAPATALSRGFALLRIVLHTGRQHQIRVHASHHGYPLVGDWMYGMACEELPGQALHAAALGFVHPLTGEAIKVQAPLPARFQALWDHLRAGGTLTPLALNEGQRSRLGLP
jgi:23S rRNA pseudouridine1911/1915/1917 synthase